MAAIRKKSQAPTPASVAVDPRNNVTVTADPKTGIVTIVVDTKAPGRLNDKGNVTHGALHWLRLPQLDGVYVNLLVGKRNPKPKADEATAPASAAKPRASRASRTAKPQDPVAATPAQAQQARKRTVTVPVTGASAKAAPAVDATPATKPRTARRGPGRAAA